MFKVDVTRVQSAVYKALKECDIEVTDNNVKDVAIIIASVAYAIIFAHKGRDNDFDESIDNFHHTVKTIISKGMSN